MVISHVSRAVRYTGRWAAKEDMAVTTAPGSMLELAFEGKECVLMFSVKVNAEPFPHVYLSLDDGGRIEAPIQRFMRVEAPDGGNHVVRLIFKSAVEDQQRWYEPLTGKISFLGAEADGEGILPEDDREIIEFIGDSVTEGIWVDEERMLRGTTRIDKRNMVFQNDSTATYAYLTAQALGMKPYIMGYGAVGITKGGGGGVPKVAEAYPYCFSGWKRTPSGAKMIVINHGANDLRASAKDYIEGYVAFLDQVREINPTAKIVVLSAFYGVCNRELDEMVKEYNRSRKDHIYYVDSFEWIPKSPMHPARAGHRIVAEKLIPELKKILND